MIDLTTVKLVKISERTSRKACRTCNAEGSHLYWAVPEGRPVTDQGSMVLIDATEVTRSARKGETVRGIFVHSCQEDRLRRLLGEDVPDNNNDDAADNTADHNEAKDVPAMPKPADNNNDAAAALDALRRVLGPQQLDADAVRDIIRTELDGYVFPTVTIVERANGDVRKSEGLAHWLVGDIATALLAGEHVMLVGPAGSGKSSAALGASELLGLPFYSLSLSPQTSESKIVGYMTADGTYVRTLFRECFEHGGTFCFDEIDNGHPSILTVVNAALANDSMAFPDGMVKRNDDFRVVATANTYGLGPDRTYVGRQKLDGATLDRFAVLDFPYDDALEEALCIGTGLDAAKVRDVLKYVRACRTSIDRHKLQLVMSPRASVGACRLLAAGMTWDRAVALRIRKGASEQDWAKVSTGVARPAWA